MKKTRFLTLILSLIVASVSIISCQKSYLDPSLNKGPRVIYNTESKAFDPKEEHSGFVVSPAMAKYYASAMKESGGIKSEDYYTRDKDTLLHLFNFNNGGYVMLSSDKRTESVLMKSEQGEVYFDKMPNPGVSLWIEDIADHMLALRDYYSIPEDLNTYRLWNNIEAYLMKKSGNIDQTKGGYYDLGGIFHDDGYWYREFIGFSYADSTLLNSGHLTTTEWGQGWPWNTSLYGIGSVTDTCVTGCGAVALAQLLYYFHYNKLYTPTGLFHTVITGGNVGDSLSQYSQSQLLDYNANSTRWNSMARSWWCYMNPTYNNSYASDFITEIGLKIRTVFNTTFSPSMTTHISSALNFYYDDIPYEYINYNGALAVSSIHLGYPLLVVAGTNPTSIVGHTWLIDGEKIVRHTTTRNYVWHFVLPEEDDEPIYFTNSSDYATFAEGIALGLMEDELVQESFYVDTQYVLMNWGYDGVGNDDLFYPQNGTIWQISDGQNSFNYQYNKRMWNFCSDLFGIFY